MRIGDTANDAAASFGKPLDGVRILGLEQMQALPWGTQMLARLGAEVVKIEHPTAGESARANPSRAPRRACSRSARTVVASANKPPVA